jgi:molecular chaperone DnaK (HSP70)
VGGTVDIAVHEIDEEGYTQSIHAPVGGAWGSTKIDENFKQFLFDIFGAEIQSGFEYPEILAAFEREKVRFNKNQKVPLAIYDFEPKHLDHNRRYSKFPIKIDRKRLILAPEIMMSFFDGPVNSIVSCVKDMLAKLQYNMDYIFLVGGFSRSIILKDRMIEEFQSATTQIVNPNNPGMAVAEGAVYFGLNPKVIRSRYSSFTYGIQLKHIFQEGIDPPENKVQVDGIWYCDKVFMPLVEVDQKVRQNHRVSELFGRVSKSQSSAIIPIYCTKRRNVKYITEDMKSLGRLVLHVPLDEDLTAHNIEVTVIFGGTEIAVTARHIITNELVSCKLEFLFSAKPEISALPLPTKPLKNY